MTTKLSTILYVLNHSMLVDGVCKIGTIATFSCTFIVFTIFFFCCCSSSAFRSIFIYFESVLFPLLRSHSNLNWFHIFSMLFFSLFFLNFLYRSFIRSAALLSFSSGAATAALFVQQLSDAFLCIGSS